MSSVHITTAVRTLVLALTGIVAVLFPGAVPDGAADRIADNAVEAVGAVLLIWAGVAAWRVKRQSEGKEDA